MKIIPVLFAACLLLAGAPAAADTTALYKAPQGALMNVEVASNGNMRATMGAGGSYMLTLDGEDYLVFYAEKGAVVVRWGDVATVMLDHIRKTMPEMLEAPDKDDPAPFKYFRGGQMTVGGRVGTVWYMQFGDGNLMDRAPKFVMSADPELAELGRAILRQAEMSIKLMAPMFGGRSPTDGIIDVLKTGAPLMMNGMELGAVTHTPIPAERFALPATPETLDQVRERFESNGGHIP